MASFQTGSLQRKKRKSGDIWVFRHRRQRSLDGKWESWVLAAQDDMLAAMMTKSNAVN
jgi:hypothetical protein